MYSRALLYKGFFFFFIFIFYFLFFLFFFIFLFLCLFFHIPLNNSLVILIQERLKEESPEGELEERLRRQKLQEESDLALAKDAFGEL